MYQKYLTASHGTNKEPTDGASYSAVEDDTDVAGDGTSNVNDFSSTVNDVNWAASETSSVWVACACQSVAECDDGGAASHGENSTCNHVGVDNEQPCDNQDEACRFEKEKTAFYVCGGLLNPLDREI